MFNWRSLLNETRSPAFRRLVNPDWLKDECVCVCQQTRRHLAYFPIMKTLLTVVQQRWAGQELHAARQGCTISRRSRVTPPQEV